MYSAYVAEVYRAGIESVHPSQRMAARSLGLGYGQMMRYVILPQAIRRVIPPLLNDFIGLQKDTAIIGVVGVTEAVQQAQTYSTTFGNFSGYMVAAVLFVYITIPLARYTDGLINRRERAREGAGVSRSGTSSQVENVTKRFEENTVLDEVSLTVAEHEVVCLIGASGSGKSTLLRCLNRLEVVAGGHDHRSTARRSPRARST